MDSAEPTTHPNPEFSAPDRQARRQELRTPLEVARLVGRSRQLARTARSPHTGGADVLVLPGLGTNDVSTLPLRLYLSRAVPNVFGWGLGTNTGDLETGVAGTLRLVRNLSAEGRRPVSLVGQSLGGIYAREVARSHPEWVKQVITLGTPLHGPRYTITGPTFAGRIERIERQIAERENTLIRVPLVAVYSRRDGVVDWRTCIDRRTPEVDNIEVGSTHFGMGIDPDVWTLIAGRL